MVALEALLQIASLVVWFAHGNRGGSSRPKGKVVLCVGDSFTFGLGATEGTGSYPSQLQSLLRRRDASWTVVNEGWPGRNSREVLLRLPRALESLRPDLVLVMVGSNDFWTHPEPVGADLTGEGGFVWRVRTLRLLSLLRLGLSATRQAPAGSTVSPAGEWSWGGEAIELRSDGTLLWGSYRGRWTLEGESLVLDSGCGTLRCGYSVTSDEMALSCSAFSARLRRGLPVAFPYVDRSREAVEALGGRDHFTVASRDVLDRAKALSARYPDVPVLPALAATQSLLLGHRDEARAFAGQVLVRASKADQPMRALAYRIQAECALPEDPASAVRFAVLQLAASEDETCLSQVLLRARRAMPRSGIEAVLADSGSPEGVLQAARRLLDKTEETSRTEAVLSQHLREIAATCERAGAQAIFISYPFGSRAGELMARVAAESGVPFLSIQRSFERVPPNERQGLFVPDGHCSDRGYALVADLVDKELRRQEVPRAGAR